MNYASKILTYLGEGNRFSQVLLVAGAPPVEKMGDEFRIIINAVFTPDDIRDTLAFFASNARRSGSSDLGNHGVFAFGMPKLGRFKVYYLTQRGSIFVSIQRMTYDIPALDGLLSQPEQVSLVESALNQAGGGIVIFVGPSPEALSRLLYAAMDRINQTRSKVIYILEQNLSYLLHHRNSVSIQVEVGTDVSSLSEGIRNGLFLGPDLMYVRDPKSSDEYSGLLCAAEAGALVLISLVAFSGQTMVNEIKSRVLEDFQGLSRLVRKTIKVSTDPSGTLSLKESPGLGAGLE
jgi:twitching motility protein PilT